MSFQSARRTHSLLVLGVALVWTALSTGDVETDTVFEYTAHEVEYADGELAATNVRN